MERTEKDLASQEEGEEQLFMLIKEAGEAARNDRKKVLDNHFELLNEAIKDAISCIQPSEPT